MKVAANTHCKYSRQCETALKLCSRPTNRRRVELNVSLCTGLKAITFCEYKRREICLLSFTGSTSLFVNHVVCRSVCTHLVGIVYPVSAGFHLVQKTCLDCSVAHLVGVSYHSIMIIIIM